MAPEVFREAVYSLRDWPGIVGIFGGNPCTHPQFPELMKILEEEIPDQRHRGLWSNNFLQHGELVRRVFYPAGRFNLNAHGDAAAARAMDRFTPGRVIPSSKDKPAMHSAILVDRSDLGVSDSDWVRLREHCDINQRWSAAIAERNGRPHAYFCEVGAALDGIRGKNNGIPTTPGWWKWKMDRFDNQVRNCCDRGCGVPLSHRGHLDRDDTYDVSKTWAESDALRGSKGRVSIEVTESNFETVSMPTDYMRRFGPK
jgi:hypothetical protein